MRLLGAERVLTHPAALFPYTYDASFNSEAHPGRPDCVVLPRDTQDVVTVMQVANRYKVPVVPRGSASAYSGGAVAHYGGIVVAMNVMDRIIEIDADNLQVLCQPGVIHANLNDALAPLRHDLPARSRQQQDRQRRRHDGEQLQRDARRQVRADACTTSSACEVVLPTGEVIWTGGEDSKALQSVSGLNLTPLFIMSEGTLGVITQLRLRIIPKPESRGLVVARFDSLEDAAEMTRRIFRGGILPAALEIMDRSAIRAVNIYKPELKLVECAAMLLIEADGTPAVVADTVGRIEQVARELATSVETATNPKEMETALGGAGGARRGLVARHSRWDARRHGGGHLRPPQGHARDAAARSPRRRSGGRSPSSSTATSAAAMSIARSSSITRRRRSNARKLLTEDIHNLALEYRGTTSGEHGIGVVRRDYADAELGAAVGRDAPDAARVRSERHHEPRQEAPLRAHGEIGPRRVTALKMRIAAKTYGIITISHPDAPLRGVFLAKGIFPLEDPAGR